MVIAPGLFLFRVEDIWVLAEDRCPGLASLEPICLLPMIRAGSKSQFRRAERQCALENAKHDPCLVHGLLIALPCSLTRSSIEKLAVNLPAFCW